MTEDSMALLITHYFEGGTEEQYRNVVARAHPAEGLPAGQLYHAAGPTDGGWLIAAVWENRESFESFVHDTLVPVLQSTDGGFTGPPQERTAEVANLVKA
jgi:hypothetical protein